MKNVFLSALSVLAFLACQKDDSGSLSIQFEKPGHFPDPTYPLERNPVTKAGFDLGKKLFNDPILSRDQSVACSNCHVKGVAFTDPQHRFSVGVEERQGIRNAPSIANMAFMQEFMWDGGVFHLDFAPPNAIENELEMDEKLSHVLYKLNTHAQYPDMFKTAFPEMDSITTPYLLLALSQYQLMLVSASSMYDQYLTGKKQLDAGALEGLALFEQKCASCHSGVLFTNQEYINNGLDTVFSDLGRGRITESAADIGKFKVPSLRNVALTPPYMHDGRFPDLQSVLQHYKNGVKDSPTLDPGLKKSKGIPMTEMEKERIIEFLQTLTDYDFIRDERL